MKSTSKPVKPKAPPFYKNDLVTDDKMIILVTDPRPNSDFDLFAGVVIHSSYVSYESGTHRLDWIKSLFKPYTGTVILEQ